MSLDDKIAKTLSSVTKSLSGYVSLKRLFDDDTIQACSSAKNIEELLGRARIVDQKSFEDWDKESCDAFIRDNTTYPDWDGFIAPSGKRYAIVKFEASRRGDWTEELFNNEHQFDNVRIELNIGAR
jgi:hypothetical protein